LFKEVKTDEEAADEKIIARTARLKPLLHTQGFDYNLDPASVVTHIAQALDLPGYMKKSAHHQ